MIKIVYYLFRQNIRTPMRANDYIINKYNMKISLQIFHEIVTLTDYYQLHIQFTEFITVYIHINSVWRIERNLLCYISPVLHVLLCSSLRLSMYLSSCSHLVSDGKDSVNHSHPTENKPLIYSHATRWIHLRSVYFFQINEHYQSFVVRMDFR